MINPLEKLTKDLIFISETDSPILPIELGMATEVSIKQLRQLADIDRTLAIEEVSIEQFFARLTQIEAWHGPLETNRAKRFLMLEKHLQTHLRNVSVFKVGEIQREIFVVGLDSVDRLSGVRTRSIET